MQGQGGGWACILIARPTTLGTPSLALPPLDNFQRPGNTCFWNSTFSHCLAQHTKCLTYHSEDTFPPRGSFAGPRKTFPKFTYDDKSSQFLMARTCIQVAHLQTWWHLLVMCLSQFANKPCRNIDFGKIIFSRSKNCTLSVGMNWWTRNFAHFRGGWVDQLI